MTVAPSLRASAAWASKRATTSTSTSGWSAGGSRSRTSEGTGAVHHHLAAGHRRVTRDRVQADRERVGEDRKLVRDLVGHLEELRVVAGMSCA